MQASNRWLFHDEGFFCFALGWGQPHTIEAKGVLQILEAAIKIIQSELGTSYSSELLRTLQRPAFKRAAPDMQAFVNPVV